MTITPRPPTPPSAVRTVESAGRLIPAPHSTGLPFWRSAAVLLLLTGIVVTLAGTFGPWLRSGSVDRNSYQIVGALQRFPLVDNAAVSGLLGAWPLLGPALMLPLVLAAFRLWRSAGALAVVLGIVGVVPSVVAVLVVGTRSRYGIQLDLVGPLTVIAGAVLVIAGGVLLMASCRRDIRVTVRGVPPRSAAGRPASGNR
ncbi:hypothetical protein [Nakamurella lactea]|uniref:hypothetical protein n=1 Tax=Nakamurella lactea TaxID=459515 RepID=UPI0012B5D12D|nr:hypothetical protein [Nakamurella lactea]